MTAREQAGRRVPPAVRFWDRLAERYASRPVPDEAVYREKLSITRRYLAPDTEVLEFGCGTGSTAIAHAPHVRRILATDISPRMLDIARRKARDGGVANIEFRQTGIEDLEVPDGAYDVALGLSILHLVGDLDGVVAKVHRALRPDGVFVSSTACIGDAMAFFRIVGPLGRMLGLLPYLNVFTTRDLETALAGAGFRIEHQWQPGRNKGVFIVARKPARAPASPDPAAALSSS